MMRSPSLHAAVLLAALALLLPLVAVVGSCTDCLWETAPDCCPPSCCSCCAHSPSVLTASVGVVLHPAPGDVVPNQQDDSHPSAPSSDIFHVPKPSLV